MGSFDTVGDVVIVAAFIVFLLSCSLIIVELFFMTFIERDFFLGEQ